MSNKRHEIREEFFAFSCLPVFCGRRRGAISAQETSTIANLKNSFTTTSNYFRIESTGVVGKSKVAKKITVIVKKEQGKVILKSYRDY